MAKKLIEMTDILTERALEDLKEGQTLTFMYEGSPADYKIAKIKDGRLWVKPTTLYKPEEITFKEKPKVKNIELHTQVDDH